MNLDEAIESLEKIVADVKKASLTDDMTSLGNSLALDRVARLMNEGESAFDVIVFGDLNDFKHLNDEHSHAAGDVAINKVGETIEKTVIAGLEAKAFRKSGDEFVIVLKQPLLRRFLQSASSLASIPFLYNDKELRTAMSLGYALSDGKTSFSELLERSEQACQNAKTKGDGVCIRWSEDMKVNPLVRRTGRCNKCEAKITCNLPAEKAPGALRLCPCCAESL